VVEAVGPDVTRFAPGDRVVTCYIQGWRDGPMRREHRNTTLGGPLPGVLQEYVVVPADDAVAAPAHMNAAEAASLPIAALTAWTALRQGGLKAGDTVLVQGTGGVALFGLQLAHAAGARVIALTSSAEKAALLMRMGAAAVIDYRKTPQWANPVREASGGLGADIIIETTGSTLEQSLGAVAFGGFVGLVGFLGGLSVPLNLRQLIGPNVCLQGVVVGSRAEFEAMNRAMALHGIHPVLDRTFALEDARSAFEHMARAGHVGKIVIDVDGTRGTA
jgi:NADPH:quinone reductase-like Zn-dependent oxidoreductase